MKAYLVFVMAPTNLKKWYLRNGRTQPLIFINNLSPELVINYFIKRVGLSSRSLRAAASGEDHTPPGIDGIRWQPLVAGLGENLPRQGADASYYHFMHENTEIICKMKVHLHRKPIRLSVKRSVLCRLQKVPSSSLAAGTWISACVRRIIIKRGVIVPTYCSTFLYTYRVSDHGIGTLHFIITHYCIATKLLDIRRNRNEILRKMNLFENKH